MFAYIFCFWAMNVKWWFCWVDFVPLINGDVSPPPPTHNEGRFRVWKAIFAGFSIWNLTKEYVQSAPSIATSIGDVWLATQNPIVFGRQCKLWNVITADSGRHNKRNDALNRISFKHLRIVAFGMMPINVNTIIAKLT